MKCKYCGYEAPVISYKDVIVENEFITSKIIKDGKGNVWIESILKCPKCGKEQ